uniref:Uncharacterized protein n=1 Tax=Siphoviridae sp. ctHip2 TaxID=2827830 RepID=A0A8S5RWV5_9CAUD|nr:MAG TPA: hypothetical protein [Siphoviridae sp. ctHip2]
MPSLYILYITTYSKNFLITKQTPNLFFHF